MICPPGPRMIASADLVGVDGVFRHPNRAIAAVATRRRPLLRSPTIMGDEAIFPADSGCEAQTFLADRDYIFKVRDLIIHCASFSRTFSSRDAPRRSRG